MCLEQHLVQDRHLVDVGCYLVLLLMERRREFLCLSFFLPLSVCLCLSPHPFSLPTMRAFSLLPTITQSLGLKLASLTGVSLSLGWAGGDRGCLQTPSKHAHNSGLVSPSLGRGPRVLLKFTASPETPVAKSCFTGLPWASVPSINMLNSYYHANMLTE